MTVGLVAFPETDLRIYSLLTLLGFWSSDLPAELQRTTS